MEFAYLVYVESYRYEPTQALAVLPGMGYTGTHAFPQDLAFELAGYS